MSAEPTVRDFIARVLPWPVEDPPGHFTGYVNIHWTVPGKGAAKQFWNGQPVQTLNGFFNALTKIRAKKTTRDLYYCLSVQSDKAVKTKDGRPFDVAVRSAENARALRSIWLDLDVSSSASKTGKVEYVSLEEATEHLVAFIAHYRLPMPTATVKSGGGLHVYWISDKPLTVNEWAPYASGLKAAVVQFGLKCDAGCTSDCARILRIPGTKNWKIDPPRPVELLTLQTDDLDFNLNLQMLPPLAPLVTVAVTAKNKLPEAFANGVSPKFAALGKRSLAAGCQHEFAPIDVVSVGKECKFIREAMINGGKDYKDPLWHITLRAASFMDDGNGLAHLMSKGHPDYVAEETQRQYERVVLDNTDKGLGWPLCATVHENGFAGCQGCPHFGKGKSPLHFGAAVFSSQTPPQSSGGDGASTSPPVNDTSPTGTGIIVAPGFRKFDLPYGYAFNPGNIICAVDDPMDETGADPDLVPLFHNVISNPFAQKGPDVLIFDITADLGHTRQGAIPVDDMGSPGKVLEALTAARVLTTDYVSAPTYRKFVVSLLDKLWKAQQARQAVPFGWHYDATTQIRRGFAYGGKLYKDDGSIHSSGVTDQQLLSVYTPTGDVAKWHAALKLITDQKRPELETIIAASFGSPLMSILEQSGLALSIWSPDSGVGKTAAVHIGAGVWGHPKLSKEVKNSTQKHILHKVGMLKNFPVYWDEIKADKAMESMSDVLEMLGEGVDGGRMNSNLEHRERGTWEMIMICCLNRSYVEFSAAKNKTTEAGIYRVFEYEAIPPLPGAPGRIDGVEFDRMIGQIDRNYGHIGAKYAHYLANNVPAVTRHVQDITKDFRAKVGTEGNIDKDGERKWTASCGAIIAGAMFANDIGVPLDVVGIRNFLIMAFHANRIRLAREELKGASIENTAQHLSQFFKAQNDNQCWVDHSNMVSGGRAGPIKVFKEPPRDRGLKLNIRWSHKERLLAISRAALMEWLKQAEVPSSAVISGIEKHYKAKYNKQFNLALGTKYPNAREACYLITVPAYSSLEEMLFSYGPAYAASASVSVLQSTGPSPPLPSQP